jgi:hypothetical protein
LTLAEAATATGYSAGYIGKQIVAGTLPNAGRKNATRVRRADLKAKVQSGRGRPARRAAQQSETKQVTPIGESTRRFPRNAFFSIPRQGLSRRLT